MNRSPRDHLNSRRGWAILAILLSIESFAGIVLVFQTTWQLLQSDQDPLGDRISLFIAVLLAWVWVLVTLFSGIRSQASWARGSALTIHILLFAAATGMLQFSIGRPLLAWALVVVAIIGFAAALLAKPATEEADDFTQHDSDDAPSQPAE